MAGFNFLGGFMERVMIFIDGSNLYHGLKKCLGTAKIDMHKFCNILTTDKRTLVHTYYYNVPLKQEENPSQYSDQQKFLANISKIPHFTIKLGRRVKRDNFIACYKCKKNYTIVKCPNCRTELQPYTYVEKGVDVSIAVDMLVGAIDNQYDTAIIVSGDGDFVPVVEEIQRIRKNVENAYFLDENGKKYFISTKCKFIGLIRGKIEECIIKS